MSSDFTFNGKHSFKNMGVYSEMISRPLFAEPKMVYHDLPGMDGEINQTIANPMKRMFFKPRIIELECSYLGNNYTRKDFFAKASRIATWLVTGTDSQLIFDDEPDIYYMAHVANLFNVQEITDYSGSFPLVFKCDPYRYNTATKSVSGKGTINIYNNGYYTPPVITLTGTIGSSIDFFLNPNTSDQKIFSVNTALNNTTIVIDMAAMNVTLNGTSILSKCSGTFFELAPGNNTIAPMAWGTSSFNYKVEYKERFL